jgi:photosystem II stability/assembly factor-like uncharacterized protein
MKKYLFFAILVIALFMSCSDVKRNFSIEKKRAQHAFFLQNSPVKKSLGLTKKARKAKNLPPNKYFEREWELTMNPVTGKPEPAKVLKLQKTLKKSKKGPQFRVPGDEPDNSWVERGPNNVGGRTRALLFDPNDVTNKRVFAGGVSGGLWMNEDITDVNSSWAQVSEVPGNINVSCIAVDPRDSNTWYLGTGEQYTAGAAVGNGVYKTTNGGLTWNNLSLEAMGVGNLSSITSEFLAGVYYVNDIIVWDNGNSSEVFVAVGGFVYQDAGNPNNWLGLQSAGLYRSLDGGAAWSRMESENFKYVFSGFDFYYIPNDFEISADNTLWMGTIGSAVGQSGAGLVYKSTDGTTWSLEATLANANRVELAVSSSDANKLYALVEGTDGVPHIYQTTDSFSNTLELPKPNDADPGIPADDFARGQDFYNLVIEVDPTNDELVYAGGIDLFRSDDRGSTWSQISRWKSSIAGSSSVVHPDQHAMAFRPGNENQAVFGNDGGVYYASSLSGAETSNTVISERNTNYNVTQFYTAAIAPRAEDEYFMGGTQDNGTPYFYNPNANAPDSSVDISGGDGAACFVDQQGEDYYIVSYVYNAYYQLFDVNENAWKVIVEDLQNTEGDFINQADLDSNLDILYTNGSSGTNYQLYRYSGLTSIPVSGQATQTALTSPSLDSSPTAIKVSPHTTTSSTLLVGTETSKVFRVTDANAATPIWTEITGINFLGSISDIQFGANENEILVTFHNYAVTSIWFSSDGGATWVSKEGNFPDIPVKSILQNPLVKDEVLVGTELGVWGTSNWSDSSPNWSQATNGMSDVKVTDLQLREEDNTVLASTFGRGLFTGKFVEEALKLTKDKSEESVCMYPTISLGTIFVITGKLYDNVSLVIHKMTGELVHSEKDISLFEKKENTLDFDVSPGFYIVSLYTSSQKIASEIIIVQ